MILKKLSASSRITVGLVCSMLGILISANLLGLLPDRHAITLQGRKNLVESIAFSNSVLLANGDVAGINAVFDNIVNRQPDVQSIAIRRYSDNSVVVSAGPHAEIWPDDQGTRVTDQFMPIPLSEDGVGDWGQVEIAFTPLYSKKWFSFTENPMLRLLFFCAMVGFVMFRMFLRMVLKNLDPSRAVPRRVREALDILAEGLMIVGTDGRILLANQAMAKTVHEEADLLIGKKAAQFAFVRPDGEADMPWEACGRTKLPVSGARLQFTNPSGNSRIFKVSCSPLFADAGKVRGIIVSFDDVTVLERNKIELSIARDAADAANRAKSNFLANMSHEIRNPMNAIVGFTDILRRGLEESDDTRVEYLNTIHASGTHLVELINDILDFSKIEAGKLELEIQPCNPYELIHDVVKVLGMKAQELMLSLTVEVKGSIPATIHSDPTRLRQILMNLVSNAIKFTAEGGIRITASTIKQGGQHQLRFEVTDTGIGLTEEQIGRLFQQFAQADASVTRRFGGTGLGLAISKRLTEALGGEIAVESEPGIGSTFYFSVAAGDISNVEMWTGEEAAQNLRSTMHSTSAGISAWFKPARVLITDDAPANRQLAGLVLRKAGLEVHEAENGAIAIEKTLANSYDLLLMDMQMPVLDGFAATVALRSHGITTPILAFTANVTQQDRQNCLTAGCTGFLTKPINIDLLLSTIAAYLPTQEHPPDSVVSMLPAPKNTVQVEQKTAMIPVAESSTLDDLFDSIDADVKRTSQETTAARSRTVAQTQKPERSPLRSQLPMAIPEFREIVESFVSNIHQTLGRLRTAQSASDYAEIREISHRLKGTGGTVGFPDFTAPSGQLQSAAEAKNDDVIEAMLTQLEELASRIELEEPIAC